MNRFTETNKWKDSWFLSLSPTGKILFFYFIENCDNAGFIEINPRLFSFMLNTTQDEIERALKEIEKCYVMSTDKSCVLLRNFLLYQKNLPLNPENNAHKQIIQIIEVHRDKFDANDIAFLGAKKGTVSPIGKGKGNSKGKGNVNAEYFEIFWEKYPRKENRKKSLECFAKINPDELLLGKMLAAINTQSETRQWKEGYIPHASTWLNQKRFEDEPDKPPPNKSFEPTSKFMKGLLNGKN